MRAGISWHLAKRRHKSTASPCRVSVNRALCTPFERAWRTPKAQMDVSPRPRLPTALRQPPTLDGYTHAVRVLHARLPLPSQSLCHPRKDTKKGTAPRHFPPSSSSSRLPLRRHPAVHRCTSPQSSRDLPANPETKEKPPRRKGKSPQRKKIPRKKKTHKYATTL
jgi:hypothetical protein